jgi:hypothetical protein
VKQHPRRRTKITGLDRRLLRQRDDVRSTLGRDWPWAVTLTAGRAYRLASYWLPLLAGLVAYVCSAAATGPVSQAVATTGP